MPSPGKAFLDGDAPGYELDDMLGRTDLAGTNSAASDSAAPVNDYVWATSIYPAPVVLDYTWLVQPLAWRPVPPVNAQTVARTGGGSAFAVNQTSIDEFTVYDGGTITLDTALAQDPKALAQFITTYQDDFRQRPAQLTFDLLERSEGEAAVILSVTKGTRALLINTPADWPPECDSVFVDGINHAITLDERLVAFVCTPLLGANAGQVGPWFDADTSYVDGNDTVPF